MNSRTTRSGSTKSTMSSQITPELLRVEINNLRDTLLENICKTKDDIINQLRIENQQLKDDIVKVNASLADKGVKITSLEREVNDLNQYIRRNNIEIVGIPDSIDQENLEGKVIELAKSMGVNISVGDIEGCHRLKKKKNNKGPARTIVRFTNRRNCEQFMRQKKTLNSSAKLAGIGLDRHKIYINNNLCPYNRFIWSKAKELYDKKMLNRFWCFNGVINIAVNERYAPQRIGHLEDLPNYQFLS